MVRLQLSRANWLVMGVLCVLAMTSPLVHAQDELTESKDPLIDWPMNTQPEIPTLQTVDSFDPEIARIWFEALNRPDALTRFEAAKAIAKAATMNMPDLVMMEERLASILTDNNEELLTRYAAAQALVAMNAKRQAEAFIKAQASLGLEMILITDPALAKWQDQSAITIWLKRLADPSADVTIRQSAARSIQQAKQVTLAVTLSDLALKEQAPIALRLTAAKAYRDLLANAEQPATKDLALNADLHKLTASKAPVIDQLMAAYLLSGSRSQAAVELLVKLASNTDITHSPAVLIAAERLLQMSPQSLDPLLTTLGKSADFGIRSLVIRRFAQQGTSHSAADIAPFLGDEHPAVRVLARDKIIELAKQPAIREETLKVLTHELAGEDPLVLEQATLAAGAVGLKTAADRLVVLLESEHIPVAVGAAVSLRKLLVPSTFAPALAYAEANIKSSIPFDRRVETAQLIQMMGLAKYEPAKTVLRKFIPKGSGASIDRQAAIWSLGLLYEGQPDGGLVGQLAARANDGQGMNPEDGRVRIKAVVAIGLMKDQGALGQLRKWEADKQDTSLSPASRWAIGQITGHRPPEPPPEPVQASGFFLETLPKSN